MIQNISGKPCMEEFEGDRRSLSSPAYCKLGEVVFVNSVWEHLQPGMWLHLEATPSPFAYCEALLLCQLTELEWLTWIPDYGEYCLQLNDPVVKLVDTSCLG